MRRLSVHLSVDDLDAAIAFYTQLFAGAPARADAESAQWHDDESMLDFGVSRRHGGEATLIRLGLPMASADDLAQLAARLPAMGDADPVAADVHWLVDPAGVLWEAFYQPDGRRSEAPSRAQYMAARLAREGEARRHAYVLKRQLIRRRSSGYSPRPEARM